MSRVSLPADPFPKVHRAAGRLPAATRVSGAVEVAFDATPLLGARTGVGAFTAGALDALLRRNDTRLRAFGLTGRRRVELRRRLPPGVVRGRMVPARAALLLWAHGDIPPIEWLTGPVDVVHGTNFVVPPARRAARVVTVHDLTAVRFPELCAPASLRYPTLVRRAIERGAWVHTPSTWVAAEVCEVFGADPARVRAVAHGLPECRSAASAASTPVAAHAPYVLALGTIEPRKDVPLLVRAFDRLARGRPELGLVIAGADGWGAAELTAAIAAAGHGDRIRRLGYVDDDARRSLLAGAAVFAYPSRYEGFGLPPLEAMAAGVPVVATSAGALPEVLGDGAVFTAPGDVEGLASALASVLDSAVLGDELRRKGRARAAGFSWERCADGLVTLYGDAVGAHEYRL